MKKPSWISEQDYRVLVDHLQDGIFVIEDEKFTYVNQRLSDMFGYPIDELIGRPFIELVADESKSTVSERHRARIAGEIVPELYDIHISTAQGTTICCSLNVGLSESPAGRTVAVGSVRDVTQHRAAQAELKAILDQLPDVFYRTNMQGIITMISPSCFDTIGYRQEEMLGTALSGYYYTPEDRQKMVKAITDGGGRATQVEAALKHKSGSIIWISTNAYVRFGLDGQAGYVEGVARDITERKHMEEALRIAATAFESHEGMMITDAHGVVLRVNRAFTETTGYTTEEIVGQTPRLLKSGRHNANFYVEMWDTIKRTGSWQGEIWDRRKNGEIYPKWLAITAVKLGDGAVTHYVSTQTDISARKAAEDVIKNMAFFDPLTQLPNRHLLNDRLSQAIAASKRSGCYGALMLLDLDNFKPLNDTHGHIAGDLLLIEVADRLNKCVREIDTVARFGGDEFVVLLNVLDTDKAESTSQAEIIAEKIRTALSEPYRLTIRHDEKADTTVEHHCTASIGVSLFFDDEVSQGDIIKWADMAMYLAKETGHNLIRFHDPKA
ncbi:MAG: PAS domain S-box protein [Gammaproteobacteria bacterium]|nr:PAS domain S-box protein [Rhodocyclaceae bacterium]MBU3909022.1 PAS domain S-box protein [Gammaproteobacteria bacterium]MBU4003779.1 PAS domain S-box protein [Gammaproteobacteria bacterium]MBU4021657.1 PAS domain S-box protein [Gammaproteobacteria bacterium]MBU4094901.1 PAS domain S-box protein [Gammaproteobacteria bacterium]